MSIQVVGLEIAKNVFQVHGADSRGKAVLRKRRKCQPSSPTCRDAWWRWKRYEVLITGRA
jgi:hypothetical protein